MQTGLAANGEDVLPAQAEVEMGVYYLQRQITKYRQIQTTIIGFPRQQKVMICYLATYRLFQIVHPEFVLLSPLLPIHGLYAWSIGA